LLSYRGLHWWWRLAWHLASVYERRSIESCAGGAIGAATSLHEH
jgi:hypothetical protein